MTIVNNKNRIGEDTASAFLNNMFSLPYFLFFVPKDQSLLNRHKNHKQIHGFQKHFTMIEANQLQYYLKINL